uniref:L1 transposable element RRM domain-containing protein n=1 Tax=Latimeria chalumnae TaxID=7897 RepID=H3A5B1_LATCH
ESKSEVASVNIKLDKLTNRMEAAENRISDCEDRLYHVENLSAEIHTLREKCDDLKNRAHRSNLRIVGIPERLEDRDPEAFMEDLILKVLGPDVFPYKLEIERDHRALRPRPGPEERPRVMIVKLLRFQDKVAILRKAREMGAILFQNQKIFFFPDLSSDLQAKRKEFTEARRLCHYLHLSFSLLYPAKLQLSLDNGVKFFMDPAEVESFLCQLPEKKTPKRGSPPRDPSRSPCTIQQSSL